MISSNTLQSAEAKALAHEGASALVRGISLFGVRYCPFQAAEG